MLFFVFFIFFFFFNDTATTEIYTLSLHDALPSRAAVASGTPICVHGDYDVDGICATALAVLCLRRSEEHTSELQSPCNLVCRLLLEKKKKIKLYFAHEKKQKKKK